MTCSRDTNGDGDCGQRGCPECGGGQIPGRTPAPRQALGRWLPEVVPDGRKIIAIGKHEIVRHWCRDAGILMQSITCVHPDSEFRFLRGVPSEGVVIVQVAPDTWGRKAREVVYDTIAPFRDYGVEIVSVDDR